MAKKLVYLGVAVFMFFSLVACKGGNPDGMFRLQEAYKSGLLAEQDLKDIAFYHGEVVNHTPRPKTPEFLCEEAIKRLKESYKEFNPNIGEENLVEARIDYYGTYNGCVIVMIWPSSWGYAATVGAETVGGVRFSYPDSNRILVWREAVKKEI